MIDIQCSNI